MWYQMIVVVLLSATLMFKEPRLVIGRRRRIDRPRSNGIPSKPITNTATVAPGYPFHRYHIYIHDGDRVYPVLVEFDEPTDFRQ